MTATSRALTRRKNARRKSLSQQSKDSSLSSLSKDSSLSSLSKDSSLSRQMRPVRRHLTSRDAKNASPAIATTAGAVMLLSKSHRQARRSSVTSYYIHLRI